MFLNVRLSNALSYFGQFEFKTEEEENIIVIIFAKRLVTLGSLSFALGHQRRPVGPVVHTEPKVTTTSWLPGAH